MQKNIIVALDNMTLDEIDNFMPKIDNKISYVKIGLELFCKYGPSMVQDFKQKFNTKIFLDLKLHDIPTTVKKAIMSLQGLPIDFLTVHLSGGQAMLEMAVEAASVAIPQATLLGVSYLTSLAEADFKDIQDITPCEIDQAFSRLFIIAKKAGVSGIVCSPHELKLVKQIEKLHCIKFKKVCPGIRFSDEIDNNKTQDQNRVMSPGQALAAGADFLVIGRSLTTSANLDQRLAQLISS